MTGDWKHRTGSVWKMYPLAQTHHKESDGAVITMISGRHRLYLVLVRSDQVPHSKPWRDFPHHGIRFRGEWVRVSQFTLTALRTHRVMSVGKVASLQDGANGPCPLVFSSLSPPTCTMVDPYDQQHMAGTRHVTSEARS